MRGGAKNVDEVKVLIAAGGTGGHLFPGIAIAEAVASLHPGASISFVGTKRGLESRILPKAGWRLEMISVPSMKDRRGLRRILTGIRLPLALLRAALLVRRAGPGVVIGIGGYAAGPVVLAAAFLGIPTAIVEPNAVAGVTNRWLGRFVRVVFTGFPETGSFFPSRKVVFTGNPVRREVLEVAGTERREGEPFTVFCFGGSQGARRINQAVVESLEFLSNLGSKVRFIHQVGESGNAERIQEAYEKAGVQAEVLPFIERIQDCYSRADLVVARAGATTVAELMALAKPAILVPYPYAADDHQVANAQCLVRIGGASMLLDEALGGDRLAAEIKGFISEPWRLERMSASLVKAGKPDAAERIVEECWKLLAAA